MGLRSPRRIFRRQSVAPQPSGLGRAIVVSLCISVGVGAVVLIGQSNSLFGRAPQPAAQATAKALDVAVVDGSTLRVQDRVLRLAGVAVPARGEACGATPDCGTAAAAALARFVRDQPVRCELDGHDSAGRAVARCRAGDLDLSAEMVATGWARAETEALRGPESRARSDRLGIWAAH